MLVALLSEVMRSSASQDIAASASSRGQAASADFAAILARRTETASVRERDDAPAERASATAEDSEAKPADSEREHAVAETKDSGEDSKDATENAWLAYPISNRAESAPAKAAGSSADSDVLAQSLLAAAGDGSDGAATLEQQISARLAQLMEGAPESGTAASTEILKEILTAMAGVNGEDGNTADAFVETLASSLKQGKNVSPDAAQALLLENAAAVNATNAQASESAGDAVDLSALLKSLALGVSKEQGVDAAQLAADEPLLAQPVKPVSADADANGVDARLIAAPVPNAATAASKAAATAQTAPVTTATTATIDKIVLDNVMYLTSKGEKTMVVQLSPPSLGELRIEVSSVKDTLHVSLLSGSPTVRDLLESHALGLRESLARNGIEVASVAVMPALAGHAAGQQYADHATPDFTRATPAVQSVSGASSDSGGASDERYRRVTPHEGTLNLFV